MSDSAEKTWEGSILDQHPNVRTAARGSSEFQTLKRESPKVTVDGVQYYVRGGDMLKDEDQLVFEWAYSAGLLTDDALK